MLLNPFKEALPVLPGSRILTGDMGLVGSSFPDPKKSGRVWSVVSLYAPVQGRSLGGIRAKLQDQKGFVTFCNQRDLELLLGLAKPGHICAWTDREYPELDSREFYGLCADEEDLLDDLYDRELYLRRAMEDPQYPDVIPNGYQMSRRLHMSQDKDVEELDMMLYDCDPETGFGPDPRFETLPSRWVRVERNNLRWEAA